MHLVSALVSGIRGAELGTAELYVRGTTNRATRYLDFEASQPITSPAGPINLDSNGAAVVYVNQLVEVVVSDSDGVEVRRFVAGDGAPAVEVISRSLTGTDYETGQRAASKPLPLSAALDLLKTSFGSTDFNVLFGGVSRSLQSALGSVGGIVFNVKDAIYGAIGDGTADDTSAVQAAITACDSAGGGVVFFPPGAYLLTGITLTSKVNLMGCGYESALALKHATNNLVSWSAVASTHRPTISALRFTLLQNNSGRLIDIDDTGLHLKIDECTFDAGAYDASGYLVYEHGTSCQTWVTRCKFLTSASTQRAFRANSSAFVALCEFSAVTPSFGLYLAAMTTGAVIGCYFDGSVATSGDIFAVATSGKTLIAGNTIVDGGGATVRMELADAVDIGNSYPSTITYSAIVTSATATTNQAAYISAERTVRRVSISGTTAAYTCPDDCGELIVELTSSVDFEVTLPSEAIGRRGRIWFLNNSGGAKTVQPLPPGSITARGGGSGTVSVADGFVYGVDWEYLRTTADTRLFIEQVQGGSVFAL